MAVVPRNLNSEIEQLADTKTDAKKSIAVIGAGPGGYAAAFMAADLGMQVTLIGSDANPGGVCLYVGCIPSKALLHVAQVIHEAELAARWGVQFSKPKFNLEQLREFKNGVVKKLTGGLLQLSKQRGVTYVPARASFLDSNTLSLARDNGREEKLLFDNIIIATGSRPASVPGISLKSERVLDSTSALALADVPKNMLVLGGGYIGLELGTVYAALGTQLSA